MAFPVAPTQDIVEQVIINDMNTPTSVVRTYIDSKYHGVVNIKRTDDHTTIQSKINTAAATGAQFEVQFPRSGSFYTPSTITLPPGIKINGNDAQISTDQNIPIFTLAGDDISGEDLELIGSQPDFDHGDAAFANQMGIFYNGGTTAFTPLNKINFRNMRFSNFYGIPAQIIHGRRIYFSSCEFDQYCRAGLWYTSVIDGGVDHCRFYGMNDLYLGTTFCYAFTATVQISTTGGNAGLITDSINPRSEQIDVSHNYAEDQAWECFDTHLGRVINFDANRASGGTGAVVAAVQNDNAPAYSPVDIGITNNRQNSPVDLDGNGGIALIGSKDFTNDSRERTTGVISGNILRGAFTDNSSASGAINLSNSLGVPVSDNQVINCKSRAFYLRNAHDTKLHDNSITDLWSTVSSPVCFYCIADNDGTGSPHAFTVMASNNRINRGTLVKPLINSFSWGGTADTAVNVYHTNEVHDAGPVGAGAVSSQNHRTRLGIGSGVTTETLGFYGTNGVVKQTLPGAPVLADVITALRNVALIN